MLLTNNYLGNIFAEVITIRTLFASAKTSAITNCRGESRVLNAQGKCRRSQYKITLTSVKIMQKK